jgi:hypothetical protein
MADVKIRDIDEGVVAFYRQRAKSKGVSLEEELRQTLADVQQRVRLEWIEVLKKEHDEQARNYGVLPDSTPGIRAERDGEPDA